MDHKHHLQLLGTTPDNSENSKLELPVCFHHLERLKLPGIVHPDKLGVFDVVLGLGTMTNVQDEALPNLDLIEKLLQLIKVIVFL